MSRLHLNHAQERCVRLAGKAMQHTAMIGPHARIGVAVSGGADSWTLIQTLLIRQRIVPFPFEIMALHINPGFRSDDHLPLVAWCKAKGLAAHLELSDHGLRAHSEENRSKSPCFYCSLLRRKRLFQLCKQYRLSHLAFGHNTDDLVSTFMLNLLHGGRIEGMTMKENFFQGKLILIRPLLLAEKKIIRKAATSWKLPFWENPCPSAKQNKRAQMLQDLALLCAEHPQREKNIYNALAQWQFKRNRPEQIMEP